VSERGFFKRLSSDDGMCRLYSRKGGPISLKWGKGERDGTFDREEGMADTSGSHRGVSGKNGFVVILCLECIQYEYTHTHTRSEGPTVCQSPTSSRLGHDFRKTGPSWAETPGSMPGIDDCSLGQGQIYSSVSDLGMRVPRERDSTPDRSSHQIPEQIFSRNICGAN